MQVTWWSRTQVTNEQIAVANLIRTHLERAGWVDASGLGSTCSYEDAAGHTRRERGLTKIYGTKHGVSGTSTIDQFTMIPIRTVYGLRYNTLSVRCSIIEGPGHPHQRPDGSFCWNPRGLANLPHEALAATIAAQILSMPEQSNPDDIGNPQWARCQKCHQMDPVSLGLQCFGCDRFFCIACQPNKKCPECDAAIEPPEGMPEWRHIAQRYQWPPSSGQYQEAILAGCGVTGSWAALVLNRTFAAVHTLDNDRIAHPHVTPDSEYINRNGVWIRMGRKAESVEQTSPVLDTYDGVIRNMEARYLAAHLIAPYRRPSTFPYGLIHKNADLLVLCLDSAAARMPADQSMARRILDVRATPTSCVFWGLPGKDEEDTDGWWNVWRASLLGYNEAERCGDHHDFVSLTAGAVTARFLTQYIRHGLPIGLWTVPFAVEGLE